MPYVNRYKHMPSGVSDKVETLVKCTTQKEAAEKLAEYMKADPGGMYAISRRPTRAWLKGCC